MYAIFLVDRSAERKRRSTSEGAVIAVSMARDFRGLFLGFVIAGVGFLAWCM